MYKIRKDYDKGLMKAHIIACKYIIKNNGNCAKVTCFFCPFSNHHNKYITCIGNYAASSDGKIFDKEVLIKSSIRFLKKYDKHFTAITKEIFKAYNRAVEKHPGTVTPAVRMLTIVEEVGEIAQAIQDGTPAEVRAEVMDTRAVLLRLWEEV